MPPAWSRSPIRKPSISAPGSRTSGWRRAHRPRSSRTASASGRSGGADLRGGGRRGRTGRGGTSRWPPRRPAWHRTRPGCRPAAGRPSPPPPASAGAAATGIATPGTGWNGTGRAAAPGVVEDRHVDVAAEDVARGPRRLEAPVRAPLVLDVGPLRRPLGARVHEEHAPHPGDEREPREEGALAGGEVPARPGDRRRRRVVHGRPRPGHRRRVVVPEHRDGAPRDVGRHEVHHRPGVGAVADEVAEEGVGVRARRGGVLEAGLGRPRGSRGGPRGARSSWPGPAARSAARGAPQRRKRKVTATKSGSSTAPLQAM